MKVMSKNWQAPRREGYALRRYRALRQWGVFAATLVLSACIGLGPSQPPTAGIGHAIPWDALPGWSDDNHAEAWPALLQSCTRLQHSSAVWQELCELANGLEQPDDDIARLFFESHFQPHVVQAEGGESLGLITGYYEPLLRASRKRSKRFRYPLYQRPPDLLTIELGDLYPDLRGRTLRGRVRGQSVVPYLSRAEIDNGRSPLRGHELAWVDDAVDLFFLHIQGSGRLQMRDGRILAVGYSDQNGHPYNAIGTRLVQMGVLQVEEVSLQTIKQWLQDNPNGAESVLNSNPSYIFFSSRKAGLGGPLGSLNVPLTAERSLAVDRRHIQLGLPMWLETSLPDGEPYQRLMFAQDTGGAIKGAVRADVFFGNGVRAENLAGQMKQEGRIYVLLPRADVQRYVSNSSALKR